MKRKIILLLLILLLFTLTACESSNTDITIEYNTSSPAYYCDTVLTTSYPVRFRLPKKHGVVEITLDAAYAYAFLGSYSELTAFYPYNGLPFQDAFVNTDYLKIFDYISIGTDVIVAGAQLAEGVYSGSVMNSLAAMITGQTLAVYTIRIVGKDGSVLNTCQIPIGKTKLELSENVDYIEIHSMIDVPDTSYQKKDGTVRGRISYENAHELDKVQYDQFQMPDIPQPIDTIAPLPAQMSGVVGTLPSLPSTFIFTSGAGGWGDELRMNSDGSFSGYYHDYEWEIGDGYPNGTEYVSDYSGRFTNIEKINDLQYSMELTQITISRSEGEQWIENGCRYIATGSYGINGSRFTLYLPGTTRASYPSAFDDWYYSYYGEQLGDTMNHYALVNETLDTVFWGD